MSSTEIEVRSGGALAVGAEQTEWTDQQLAVLRSVGVSEDVTPAELTAFLHESQRTGLDPFSKQIYLIGRKDKKAGREVFRSQTGIDGYRVVAHRAARRDGVALSYADTVWCGPDSVWREVWLWENPPLAAKVTVFRDGQPFPAVATLNEYAARYPSGDPYPMWAKMPATMLAKCAEALALRKAFPHDLSGIYTAEEMEQADARSAPTELTVEQAAEKMHRNQQRAQDAADVAEPPDHAKPSSHAQRTRLVILVKEKRGILTDAERHAVVGELLGREVASFKDLTSTEAHQLIDRLTAEPDHIADAEIVPEQVPSEPNPRNGGRPISPGVEAALATPTLGQLVHRAAEQNQTVGALLYAHIAAAQLAEELERLFKVAVQGRDGGHISPQEFAELDQLGRAASEDLAKAAQPVGATS